MEDQSRKTGMTGILIRIVLCAVILGVGLYALQYFASRKKPPHRAKVPETAIQVQVAPAVPVTVQTRLPGFGVVQPHRTVHLAAEVTGRIVHMHPDLSVGRHIAKGEILFRLDSSDYQTQVSRLTANLSQISSEIRRIETEFRADRQRLTTIRRNRDLARAEYERIRVLLEENDIGNRSELEHAEQVMNTAGDLQDQMARSLDLYPIQIDMARSRLKAAQADLEKASSDLERCTVTAPFGGRVSDRFMEPGEYATPGRQVVALADDGILEIAVSLDAREAVQWLHFQEEPGGAADGWFPVPAAVPCTITWLEQTHHAYTGVLDRVTAMDQESRTITVVIRFDPGSRGCDACPPLVAGMFCRVEIPGKPISDVFGVSRWAVTSDDTIYMAREERLKTVSVTRAYADGDVVYLRGDIRPGDLIITTRLVDPLENSALRILEQP